jgi:predicted dehydrogenase
MHTMRGDPALAAMRRAVRGGEIGEPLLSFSQKTYKWGKDRSDAYRSRKTFAGIAPWVGLETGTQLVLDSSCVPVSAPRPCFCSR